jgi:hypothetical protein
VVTYDVTEGWRKLRNEKLHTLYSLPYIIRMISSKVFKWTGRSAHVGQKRSLYKISTGITERKRPRGRPRRRWEDTVKMGHKYIGGLSIWLMIRTSGKIL